MDFAVPEDQRVKIKESEKRNKYLDFAKELKNKQTAEREGDGVIVIVTTENIPQSCQRAGRVRNKRKNGSNLNYSIVKIGQNN